MWLCTTKVQAQANNKDTLISTKLVHISTYKRIYGKQIAQDSLQPIALEFEVKSGHDWRKVKTGIIDGKFYPVRILSLHIGEWRFRYKTLSGKIKEVGSFRLANEATHFIIVLRENE